MEFESARPDIVVVNLLQNDQAVIDNPLSEAFKKRFSGTKPSDDEIASAYSSFIKKIRQHYPKTFIICLLGNMQIAESKSRWPAIVVKAVDSLDDSRVFTHFVPFKQTPGHPNKKGQQAIATSLINFIEHHIRI